MDLAALLEDLVRVPSPTGAEAAAVALMQEQARRDGLRVKQDDVGNLLVETGPSHGPTLMLLGHIDTVPGGPEVRREGGVLWGRGTVDAKGPLAAAYAAAIALGKAGVRVRLVGAVGEEGDSRGARALLLGPRPDAVIVLEPSGWDGITVGYKGIVRGTLDVRRPASHGAHPGGGAADALLDAWLDIRSRFGLADGFDTVSGRLDHVEADATRGHARFQLRLPPQLTPRDAEAALHEVASRHDATITVDETVPPVLCDERSPLINALRAAIRAEGGQPRLKRKTGTADLNLAAAAWPGVPMCAYGPGDAMLDHTDEEHIAVDEVARGARVIAQAGRTWALTADAGQISPVRKRHV